MPALSFDVASGQTITDTTQITGPGIVLTGGGTLVLDNAANSYSGATIVEQGQLSIGTAGDIGTGTLTLGNGTALDLTSGFTLTQAIEISGDPAFTVGSGQTNTFTGPISDGTSPGTVELTGGGTLVLDPTSGPNTYSGGTTIEDGSTLEIGTAGAAGSGAISFSGTGNTIEIAGTTIPSNTIDGFAAGDTIQIDNFVEQSGVYRNNTLTLSGTNGSGGSETVTLDMPGLLDSNFSVNVASTTTTIGFGTGETDIACYCRGTLICTKRGQENVEELKIGDEVMTASGALRPIKWIGWRSYSGRFIIGRTDILPICIKAGALDANVPKRDLWISPHHAMYLDGVLIEAKDLVNGVSIVQAESIDKVEYFHIELETHDVIVAEGALSETFLDDDSRGMFHNAHDYDTLYADMPSEPTHYCAPRCDQGYELEAVRRAIARRAGLAAGDGAGPLRGYVDAVGESYVKGWAQNAEHPEAPVCLDIYAGGRLIGQTLANLYREDLAKANLGSGRHGFVFRPPAGVTLALGTVDVRRSHDSQALGYKESGPASTERHPTIETQQRQRRMQ